MNMVINRLKLNNDEINFFVLTILAQTISQIPIKQVQREIPAVPSV